jgi:hypothetical protein
MQAENLNIKRSGPLASCLTAGPRRELVALPWFGSTVPRLLRGVSYGFNVETERKRRNRRPAEHNITSKK